MASVPFCRPHSIAIHGKSKTKTISVGKTEKIFKNPDNKMTQDYITGRFG